MKRLYRYYPKFDFDEVHWIVYEEATSQIVAEFFFEDDAAEYCKFLTTGGGFAGFTPSFVIKKTQFGSINETFAAQFAE